MPKQPPKKWFSDCVKGVKKSSPGVTDPAAVCGDLWYNKMGQKSKKKAMQKDSLNLDSFDTNLLNEMDIEEACKKNKKLKKIIKKEVNEILNEFGAYPPIYSSKTAQTVLDKEIVNWTKELKKSSQKIIKDMLTGVKNKNYKALDISRALHTGAAQRGQPYELEFIQNLWKTIREKLRKLA